MQFLDPTLAVDTFKKNPNYCRKDELKSSNLGRPQETTSPFDDPQTI
jgi:hypothetical protein